MAHILPVRPILLNGESIHGVLCKLSKENGYKYVTWLNYLEPCLKSTKNDASALAAIFRMIDVSERQRTFTTLFVQNDALNKYRSVTTKICPICLHEGLSHQAIWEITFACACPYHHVELIDTCLKCNKPLQWNNLVSNRCKCGGDLLTFKPKAASDDMIYLNAKLWAAADHDVQFLDANNYPDSYLSPLTLEQLCRLYVVLSSFGDGIKRSNRNRPNIAACISELKIISKILQDWPMGMMRHLDTYRDANGNIIGEGLQQAFGHTYLQIYNRLSDNSYDFVKKVFEEYVNANWVGILDGNHKRIQQEAISNDFISIKKAENILGVGVRRMRRFLAHNLFDAVIMERPSGRRHTIISESEVRKFSEVAPYLINSGEILSLLGITQNQFQALTKAGYLKPYTTRGEIDSSMWWFDARPIEKIISDISDNILPQEPDPLNVPFNKVCRVHLKCLDAIPQLIDSIRNGSLLVTTVKSEESFSLRSLHFTSQAIAKFISDFSQEKHGGQSIPDITN